MNSNFVSGDNMEQREWKPLMTNANQFSKTLYYACSIFATFLFGTKFFILEICHMAQIWIFFFAHLAIWMTSLFLLISYYLWYKRKETTLKNYILRDSSFAKTNYKLILLAFGTGATNMLGNISIIFAIKTAHDAGSSPAVITSILTLNVS